MRCSGEVRTCVLIRGSWRAGRSGQYPTTDINTMGAPGVTRYLARRPQGLVGRAGVDRLAGARRGQRRRRRRRHGHRGYRVITVPLLSWRARRARQPGRAVSFGRVGQLAFSMLACGTGLLLLHTFYWWWAQNPAAWPAWRRCCRLLALFCWGKNGTWECITSGPPCPGRSMNDGAWTRT